MVLLIVEHSSRLSPISLCFSPSPKAILLRLEELNVLVQSTTTCIRFLPWLNILQSALLFI